MIEIDVTMPVAKRLEANKPLKNKNNKKTLNDFLYSHCSKQAQDL